MAKLIYTVLMLLDGYISGKNGNFDWAEPDEEVHSFVNEFARDDGTYLYGRRMYEVMAVWQTLPTHDQPSFIADFANIWRAADKVVYSKTLKTASTPKTHIEQHFEPEACPKPLSKSLISTGVRMPGVVRRFASWRTRRIGLRSKSS